MTQVLAQAGSVKISVILCDKLICRILSVVVTSRIFQLTNILVHSVEILSIIVSKLKYD